MPYSPSQIKDATKNFLVTTTDFALFLLAFGMELGAAGYSSRGVHRAASFAENISYDSIVRSIKHAREKGWIKGDLTMSREGERRLAALFPLPRPYPKRWNETWYLISFDIPRTLNYKRNRLRQALKKLGFGKLHESLWISPQALLGDVIEWSENERMAQYLLPATSKELGRKRSQMLANDVWKIKQLHLRYVNWIGAMSQAAASSRREELFFEYLNIVRDDPFLPLPLLREGFAGIEAHAVARKAFSDLFKRIERAR